MVQDIPGFVKSSHATSISLKKKKNPTNENHVHSEKWFYTDIVFILNEENKL